MGPRCQECGEIDDRSIGNRHGGRCLREMQQLRNLRRERNGIRDAPHVGAIGVLLAAIARAKYLCSPETGVGS